MTEYPLGPPRIRPKHHVAMRWVQIDELDTVRPLLTKLAERLRSRGSIVMDDNGSRIERDHLAESKQSEGELEIFDAISLETFVERMLPEKGRGRRRVGERTVMRITYPAIDGESSVAFLVPPCGSNDVGVAGPVPL